VKRSAGIQTAVWRWLDSALIFMRDQMESQSREPFRYSDWEAASRHCPSGSRVLSRLLSNLTDALTNVLQNVRTIHGNRDTGYNDVWAFVIEVIVHLSRDHSFPQGSNNSHFNVTDETRAHGV
jgi:hypothetical protein